MNAARLPHILIHICFISIMLWPVTTASSSAPEKPIPTPSSSAALITENNQSATLITENNQDIVQKSLTVLELDKEIIRLELTMEDNRQQTETLQASLKQQREQIQHKQTQIDGLIRNIYMGERRSLWQALLSAKSIPDALSIWEILAMLTGRDKQILDDYASHYTDSQLTFQQIVDLQSAMLVDKTNLVLQRAEAIKLQNDIDHQLATDPNSEQLKKVIEQVTEEWETTGIAAIRVYFNALASAMEQFPQLLTKNGKSSLSLKKLDYQVIVSDYELNRFLREQDVIFDDFEFSFKQGYIVASGNRDGTQVRFQGHYTIHDDDQMNAILFHLDELIYNGITLPQATREQFEKQFDLGFYPQKLLSFVKANSIKVEEHTLTVTLKLSL